MRLILIGIVFGAGFLTCVLLFPPSHPPCPGPVISPPDASASSPGASPSTLSVTMTINEDQTASDGKSKVTLLFSSIDVGSNNCVDFSHGETVTCNNDGSGPLQFDTNKAAYVTRVGPTGDYICTYQQNSRSTPVLITMPRGTLLRPQFLPSNQSRLTVTYDPNSDPRLGKCPVEIDANGPQTIGTQTISSAPNLQDNGQYTIPDISGLSGQGTIVITRTCTSTAQHPNPCVCPPRPTPTQFAFVKVTYKSTATLDMSWNPTDP
jgi:hypothetical protein